MSRRRRNPSPPSTNNGHELLRPREAAQRLGISVATLPGWRARGFGPAHIRISSRAVRYAADEIDRWLAQRVRASTSATSPPREAP